MHSPARNPSRIDSSPPSWSGDKLMLHTDQLNATAVAVGGMCGLLPLCDGQGHWEKDSLALRKATRGTKEMPGHHRPNTRSVARELSGHYSHVSSWRCRSQNSTPSVAKLAQVQPRLRSISWW